jgi:hypothetical protein
MRRMIPSTSGYRASIVNNNIFLLLELGQEMQASSLRVRRGEALVYGGLQNGGGTRELERSKL